MNLATLARLDAAAPGMPGTQRTSHSDALLYVTNLSSTVTIYSYPRGKKVGVIGGLSAALGACTDPAQNVYITDDNTGAIYEYPHGGTTPIKVLSDPDGEPESCAVDSVTGNLAVTSNHFDTPGSILIYSNATGSPVQYGVDAFCHYGSIAYDQKGDLFGAGFNGGCSKQTSQTAFHVFELLAGTEALRILKVKVTPTLPYGLRSDGTHLLIGDPVNGRVDRYTVVRDRAKFVDSIQIQGIPLFHNFIVTKFASGYRVIGDGKHAILSWQYPQGGAPIEQLRHLEQPAQFALSE